MYRSIFNIFKKVTLPFFSKKIYERVNNFILIQFNFNTLSQRISIRIGRCIPSTCTRDDIEIGFTSFLQEALNNKTYIGFAVECHIADEEIKMEADDWGFFGLLLVFAIIIALGTFVDITVTFFGASLFPVRVVQVFQGLSVYHNTIKIFRQVTG